MDLWKFTPLHEAAAKGKYEICKLLLKVRSIFSNKNVIIYKQYGADVHRKNRDNLTPLDLVKDPESDLADLLRGDAALLDAAKKGDIDRVIEEKAKNVFYFFLFFRSRNLSLKKMLIVEMNMVVTPPLYILQVRHTHIFFTVM